MNNIINMLLDIFTHVNNIILSFRPAINLVID